jgi:hypothetical protein
MRKMPRRRPPSIDEQAVATIPMMPTAWIGPFRASLEHPVVRPLLAAGLTAFYVATGLGRGAFGVPFLLVWAAFMAAFFIGWATWRVLTDRLAGRSWRSAATSVTVILVALSAALAWYLVSRRVIGGMEQATALWASAIVAASVVIGGAVRWRAPSTSGVAWLLPAQVLAAWIASRGYLLATDLRLYDFRVYLAGGRRFVEGEWPYLVRPLEQLPPTASDDVFLYPPPLLPVFGWFSQIEWPLQTQLWIAVIVLAAIPAFRLLGVRWPYVAALLLFPPLIKGVESGNVANVVFLLFAAGALIPALLPIGMLFKPQFAIPSLWLLRERRWGSVALSALLVIAVVGATLPVTGLDLWIGWIEGLRHREASQHEFPILYGWSLARYLPLAAFAAISLVAVAVPLFLRGRRSLAGFGLATILASPSLWPHGFVFALPALLAMPSPWIWVALGVADGPWLWLVVLIGYLGLLAGRWEHGHPITDPTHPLVGTPGVWPSAGGRAPVPTDRS